MDGYSWNQPSLYADTNEFQCSDSYFGMQESGLAYRPGWTPSYLETLQDQLSWQQGVEMHQEQNQYSGQNSNEGTWQPQNFESWTTVCQPDWQTPELLNTWSDDNTTAPTKQEIRDWLYQCTPGQQQEYTPTLNAPTTTQQTVDYQTVGRFTEEGQGNGHRLETDLQQGLEATQFLDFKSEMERLAEEYLRKQAIIEENAKSIQEMKEMIESMTAKLALRGEAVQSSDHEEELLQDEENREPSIIDALIVTEQSNRLGEIDILKSETELDQPVLQQIDFSEDRLLDAYKPHTCDESDEEVEEIYCDPAPQEMSYEPETIFTEPETILVTKYPTIIPLYRLPNETELERVVLHHSEIDKQRLDVSNWLQELEKEANNIQPTFFFGHQSETVGPVIAQPVLSSIAPECRPEDFKAEGTTVSEEIVFKEEIAEAVEVYEETEKPAISLILDIQDLEIFEHIVEMVENLFVDNEVEELSALHPVDLYKESVDSDLNGYLEPQMSKSETVEEKSEFSWILDDQDLQIQYHIAEMVEDLYLDAEMEEAAKLEAMVLEESIVNSEYERLLKTETVDSKLQTLDAESVEMKQQNSDSPMDDKDMPYADFESYFLELPLELVSYVGTPLMEKHFIAKRRFQHDYSNAAAKLRFSVQGYPKYSLLCC